MNAHYCAYVPDILSHVRAQFFTTAYMSSKRKARRHAHNEVYERYSHICYCGVYKWTYLHANSFTHYDSAVDTTGQSGIRYASQTNTRYNRSIDAVNSDNKKAKFDRKQHTYTIYVYICI